MKEDPAWLNQNFEFLYAREFYDTVFLKTILRRYAILKHEMNSEEEIRDYQGKIISLFENAPIFLSSQVIDSKADDPLYAHKHIQENAFQIPDKLMLQHEKYWCPIYKQVKENSDKLEWENRLGNAVFFGPSTGMNRAIFGYGNSDPEKLKKDK